MPRARPRPAGRARRGTPAPIPATTGRWRLPLEPPAADGRDQAAEQREERHEPGVADAELHHGATAPGARRSASVDRSDRSGRSVAADGPGLGRVRRLDARRGSGAGTSRGRRPARPARPRSAGRRRSAAGPARGSPARAMTSSDDRRLNRIRIKARAIDASHAATVRITIVKTWPGPVAVVAAEPDERQRRPLEHHLGREEHHDQVPPREEPEHPQRHQGGADEQVVRQHVEREGVGHGGARCVRVGRIVRQTSGVGRRRRRRRSSVRGRSGRIGGFGRGDRQGADQGDEQQGAGELDGDEVVGVERLAQPGDVAAWRRPSSASGSRAVGRTERPGPIGDGRRVRLAPGGRGRPRRAGRGRPSTAVARLESRPRSARRRRAATQSSAEEEEEAGRASPGTGDRAIRS